MGYSMDFNTHPSETPLVAVIMPVFNGEKFLSEALQSVFAQTYKHWHLFVINDNSSDNTKNILDNFCLDLQNITIIENRKNLGIAMSRNEAIIRASSDWIAFLDADDVWHPQKLMEQLDLAANTGSSVVFSPYYIINDNGIVTGHVSTKKVISVQDMSHYNPIGNLTGMYNAKRLGKVLQSNIKHEDYLMWMQIVSKAGKAYSTSKPLAFYRKTSNGVSAQKAKTIRWQWSIYREVFGYGTLKSMWSLSLYALHNLTKIKSVNKPVHYSYFTNQVGFPKM